MDLDSGVSISLQTAAYPNSHSKPYYEGTEKEQCGAGLQSKIPGELTGIHSSHGNQQLLLQIGPQIGPRERARFAFIELHCLYDG